MSLRQRPTVGSFSRGCQQRALARFERFSERVEFAEAEAAALVELETGGAESLIAEFERRALDQAVDEELARLKAGTS